MEYITLHNGVKMPLVGFGTVDMFDDVCINAVAGAIVNGYPMIDAAHMYKNEAEVGKGIKLGLEKAGKKREDIFIVSKVNDKFTSYEKTWEAVKKSLENLQTDYLDLYLVHEPYPEATEMYRALEEAYEQGLLRAIGISNFNRLGYDRFCKQVKILLMINQIESNVFYPQNDFKKYMAEKGTCAEAWAPLSAGLGDIAGNEILTRIAGKYGKSNAQIALRYLVQSGTPVIPRSKNSERQKANLDLFDFVLTVDEMAEISTIDGGRTFRDWMEEWDAAEANK